MCTYKHNYTRTASNRQCIALRARQIINHIVSFTICSQLESSVHSRKGTTCGGSEGKKLGCMDMVQCTQTSSTMSCIIFGELGVKVSHHLCFSVKQTEVKQ